MTRFTFPVYGHSNGMTETLAVFFTDADATDFAMNPERFGAERRNLYIAEPNYDRRVSGYRPAVARSGYAEWLASVDAGEPLSELRSPEGWSHAA